MKNLFKKITAVLLVTLLLVVSVPLHSSACFDSMQIPAVEKIEVNDSSQAVSLKEVDRYFTEMFKILEESGIDLDSIKEDMPSLYESLFSFQLYSSCFDYKFDVTLASGKKYTFSTREYALELNKIYSVEIDAFITYENYLNAKENGADEIQTEIYARLFNNLKYDYVYSSEYTATDVLPVTEMYVKSITPVSGIPEKFYADADYIDIEGAEFIIEYADGETVTATAKAEPDNQDLYIYNRYTLNGAPLYVYNVLSEGDADEGEETYEFYFEYLDAYCKTPAECVEDSLFKSVKITDCVFDAENAYLSSLTYELTYEDGRTVSFTKEFTESENPFEAMSSIINSVDGYDVALSCSLGDIDADSEKINADAYYITVFVGDAYDTYEIDNPYKDVMNGSLNAAYSFINLFIKIQEFFNNLLDLRLFVF